MAEEFIEEIYNNALVLEELKETAQQMRRMMVEGARRKWNSLVVILQEKMEELYNSDSGLAESIITSAEHIRDSYWDPVLFADLIEMELIPYYQNYLKLFSGIEVTEGRYTLCSAQNGFLTIYDSVHSLYFHSLYDPMWEARVLAEELWNPSIEEFHIFGMGLGYLAYQIWKLAVGAVKIFIYEVSDEIVKYANHYGVIGWIPDECMEIVLDDDKERLAKLYHKNVQKDKVGKHISIWMGREYEKNDQGKLLNERLEADACRWFYVQWEINLRENRKLSTKAISDFYKILQGEQWVVVAAGPSLNDQIDFLKNTKKRIVAVDVILHRLINEGIIPDLVVTADPQDHMTRYIAGIEQETETIPLIADRLASWRYLKEYRGPITLIASDNSIKEFGPPLQKEDGNWNIGGTVASLAIEAAIHMGAKNVYLLGVDLAYPDGEYFADGVINEGIIKERGQCIVDSVDEGKVESSKTFVFFKNVIERQIEKYSNIVFYNLSKKGARIKGCREYKDFV